MLSNKHKQILVFAMLIISIAIAGYSINQVNKLRTENHTLMVKQEELSQNLKVLNELNTESNSMVQELTIELQQLNTEKLELQSTLNNTISLDELSIERLTLLGYEDYSVILDDLLNHNALIPFDGVLGGSMGWQPGGSYLLNDRWAYAAFEDGHVAGYALLKYEINTDKSIKWTVIDAFIN